MLDVLFEYIPFFPGKSWNLHYQIAAISRVHLWFSVGETAEKFVIKPDELQQCMFCLENRPVIFLKTTVEFARKVRELLKLESKEGGLCFDPDDTGKTVVFLQNLQKCTSQTLSWKFNEYDKFAL